MWDPAQYKKFEEERTRPAKDLAHAAALALGDGHGRDASRDVSSGTMRGVDLGCGPGNSTAVLADRWPGANIIGVDNSPEMIERARADYPNGEWIVADAAAWTPGYGGTPAEKLDLVFSNACIQWIPGHEALIPRLFSFLAEGGVLAVQVPANGDSPLHRAVKEVAARPRWRATMAGAAGSINYRQAPYYMDILSKLGAASYEAWETTYYHRLADGQALIEWYRGTGMRPFLQRLGEAERKAFEDEVLERALPEHDFLADGQLLFPFRRIFFTATRG